jgi:hypothetical protein
MNVRICEDGPWCYLPLRLDALPWNGCTMHAHKVLRICHLLLAELVVLGCRWTDKQLQQRPAEVDMLVTEMLSSRVL